MMNTWRTWTVAAATAVVVAGGSCEAVCWGQQAVRLPSEVRAVWELDAAHRDVTATRDRVCINGLWQWQPADPQSDQVPEGDWGYFKVPGAWPGITSYMQKDFQTVHAHPRWKDTRLSGVTAAWYQREITIPEDWEGRRIAVNAEYLNSYAVVYVDGRRAGEMRFPAGEVEIGSLCRPGQSHMLTMLVVALPLQGVRMSYNDSNAAREVRGSVARRGLCGDVFPDCHTGRRTHRRHPLGHLGAARADDGGRRIVGARPRHGLLAARRDQGRPASGQVVLEPRVHRAGA
jgi:hypothetical protein